MSVAKRLLEEEIKKYARGLQNRASNGEFGVDVTGILELKETLKLLDEKFASRLTIKILKKAAQPILADLKRRAPRDGGSLERSIKIASLKQKSGVSGVMVRPHLDKASAGKPYYARFVEGGTADRYPKGRGSLSTKGRALASNANGIRRYFVNAKGIKARPFVSQTFAATREQFVKDFEQLSTEIIKEALDE